MNNSRLFLIEYGFYFCIVLSVLICILEAHGFIPSLGKIISDYEAKYWLRLEAKRARFRDGNQ